MPPGNQNTQLSNTSRPLPGAGAAPRIVIPHAPGFDGNADLAGSGSLAASGAPALASTADLAGSGTLVAAGVPNGTATAPLAGSGTLAATDLPAEAATAALAGSGTLTVAGTPAGTTAAVFAATGSLAVSGVPAAAGAAAFSSEGSLTAAALPADPATPPGGGDTYTVLPRWVPRRTPALHTVAALSGSGRLDATGISGTAAVADLTPAHLARAAATRERRRRRTNRQLPELWLALERTNA